MPIVFTASVVNPVIFLPLIMGSPILLHKELANRLGRGMALAYPGNNTALGPDFLTDLLQGG